MTAKKKTKDNVEDTLACSAFAEAGEPCPLDDKKAVGSKKKKGGSVLHKMEDDLACTAFSDQNEQCPIGEKKTGTIRK